MIRVAQRLTSFGAALALVSALAASGCGLAPRGMMPGARPGTLAARNVPYQGVKLAARTPVRHLSAPLPEAVTNGLEADDAPADPPAAGKPLPKPTPTPPPAAPGEGPAPDDIDRLLVVLQNYGYNGGRRQMIRDLLPCVQGYPLDRPETPYGWGKDVNVQQHFEWWKTNIAGDIGSWTDYRDQALFVAQNKRDVVYYVWLSKQEDPETQKRLGNTSLFVDLNKGIPVTKSIFSSGWQVEIGPSPASPTNAEIRDFFQVDQSFLRDLNHFVEIPADLYF